MLKKIESYWCDSKPVLDDIKEAYDIVNNQDVVVQLMWFVAYSGMYTRLINKATIEEYPNPETYFEQHIPKTYAV